jgi:hypothetical protein
MSEPAPNRWIGWIALLWCAGWSTDLLAAWRHAPYDRLGWVAASGWAIAFLVAAKSSTRLAGWWLAVGGLASFISVAGELNVAQHAALALVAAALAGGGFRGAVLVLLALGWMPVLGWALRATGPAAVNSLRAVAALAAVGTAWRWRRSL